MHIVPVRVCLVCFSICICVLGFKMISMVLRGNHSEVYNSLFAYI